MNLKRIKTIGIFAIFLLSFLTHFLYSIFPNFIFSVLFPVNESIWEHMKMLVSSILIWQIIEYFLLRKLHINFNNFLLSSFIMAFLSIFIFLIIYYPIYKFTGENFILNIICLFITIYFVSVVGYRIMRRDKIKNEFIIGLFGIVCLYIVFGLLTYFPPTDEIFLDQKENKYGINTYVV